MRNSVGSWSTKGKVEQTTRIIKFFVVLLWIDGDFVVVVVVVVVFWYNDLCT